MASVLATVSLAAVTVPALADSGPGGGGGAGGMGGAGPGGAMPSSQGTMDRTRDQDRLQDGTGDQDRDRDRDRLQDGSGDRDQDRLRDRDRINVDQAVVGQMASWQLLSDQERLQFHNRMQQATSAEERNRIRSEFQNTIRERAGDLGVSAPFGPQRPGSGMRDGYYLAQMLTAQERLAFHQRMRAANSSEERNRIRTEMQTTARERAREMGIDVPAWFAGGPNK
ncbi:hypothetical protein LK12_16215 [Novosphingobium malaysiense]|uniref:LTXXQ motif family protein n=2 Tax=Novosphingobium malaysiense TaxID=1348853 RepID=A0A0B1ZGI5_9SPHN|nr:hypothetical protein LK12_16215 [Novosphingobium malaysiense]